MNVLKQSTAVTIKLGPFVDATNGVTAEDALTITQADVRLSKNGGNIAQKNEATSATHDEIGYYDVPLDTTDTNTVGTLRVMVSESGALPVFRDFQIVEEAVYDALFGSGAAGPLLASADGSTLTTLATASALATVDANVDSILEDTATTIPGTLATLATASALATVDGIVDDILVDTGTTLPATLGTLATASALATVDGIVDDILVDTGTTIPASIAGIDTKIGTPVNLDTGADLATNVFDIFEQVQIRGVALDASVAAVQTDLDILTGTDGVILATTQANYPAIKADTAYDVTTTNGTLETTFAS